MRKVEWEGWSSNNAGLYRIERQGDRLAVVAPDEQSGVESGNQISGIVLGQIELSDYPDSDLLKVLEFARTRCQSDEELMEWLGMPQRNSQQSPADLLGEKRYDLVRYLSIAHHRHAAVAADYAIEDQGQSAQVMGEYLIESVMSRLSDWTKDDARTKERLYSAMQDCESLPDVSSRFRKELISDTTDEYVHSATFTRLGKAQVKNAVRPYRQARNEITGHPVPEQITISIDLAADAAYAADRALLNSHGTSFAEPRVGLYHFATQFRIYSRAFQLIYDKLIRSFQNQQVSPDPDPLYRISPNPNRYSDVFRALGEHQEVGRQGLGYPAGPGWEYPTGWGVPDGASLVEWVNSYVERRNKKETT